MTERRMPRYPMYIPSKGRFENCLAAKMFDRDGVPFRLVVEEPEHDEYASRFGEERVLVLPWTGRGLTASRNWIMQHSIEEGHERHWQFDDNIRDMIRVYKGQRLYVRSGVALAVCEDFTDRYTNVAISGFQYDAFTPLGGARLPPFMANQHVYSSSLINNKIPHRWRRAYNDDTDLCLQVLSDGWCTILLYAFLIKKLRTMMMKGGNTDALYGPEYDGRLKMARSLERDWPGVVSVARRFERPQHIVKSAWRKFDTPLQRRPDLELPDTPNEYGMKVTAVAPVKSEKLRSLIDDASET